MTYEEFIQNIINTRGQWNTKRGEYWEGHHIVPKCMGGLGKTDRKHPNIIRLYAQEHYEAHRLLYIENPTSLKLARAWFAVSHCINKNGKCVRIDANEYARLRKKISESTSKQFKGQIPWNKGKHDVYSEKSLKRMSCSLMGHVPWNKGKKHSSETIEKIKVARKLKQSGENEPHLGKHHSAETKLKLQEHFRNNPSRSVMIIDESTNTVYISKSECIRKLGIGRKALKNHLRNNKEWKGHRLRILKENSTCYGKL